MKLNRRSLFGFMGGAAVAGPKMAAGLAAVEWFVWDAEHPLSTLSRAEVVRQAETLEEALRGL